MLITKYSARKSSVYRTAASSIVLRIVSLATTLLQIPLVLPYLGEELFGFWMVLNVIGSFFGFSDLGISSAFQNDVTEAAAFGKTARLRTMFVTAQMTMLALALCAGILMVAVTIGVGKMTFLRGLSTNLADEAILYVVLFVFFGVVNVPLALGGKLAFGLHCGFLANLTLCFSQILTLATLAVVTWCQAPFTVFLLATTFPSLLCNLLLSMRLFRGLHPDPNGARLDFEYARRTVTAGMPFLGMSASWPSFMAIGPLFISYAFGPTVVTTYSLVTRALGVIQNMQSGILAALWPSLTDALARKDSAWAWKCLRISVVLSVGAFCIPTLLFPIFGPRLLSLWSGLPKESFPSWMIWPMTLLFVAIFFQGPFCVALHAAGSVKLLAGSIFTAATASSVLALIFPNSPELIPAWLAVTFALFCIMPPILQTLRTYRRILAS